MARNRSRAGVATPHRVAVLVRDGVLPLELGLVLALFRQARSADDQPLYEVLTCTPVPGPVRTDADVVLLVEHGPEALAAADTVILPAAHGYDQAESHGELSVELRAALATIRPGARVASVCSGAFVLAAVGWLDGRRATTHWNAAQRFRRLFPAVTLDENVLYVDEGQVLTSAGEAAGIDLCLHMIRCDFGAAVAGDVARMIVVPPHREGGQAQFIRRPVPEPDDTFTGAARTWAAQHLEKPLTLADLAAHAALGVRTFSRRFHEEVGMSPGRWLTQQRVDRARELLEDTDLPVEQVAERAGLGTAASLRQHLQAALGVSPSAYRSTFRGSQAPAERTQRLRG